VFCISVSFFSEVFHIMDTFSLILSIFVLNSFISLFMVFSVSLWHLFRAAMSSLIFLCVFSYFHFCCLGISWVPPVCFGWPCLVTSPWNSQWFLLLGCSCGLHWVPWDSLSLFCWSLCFLHFPLNPILFYFGGENGFHPFFVFPSFQLVLFSYLVCV
jgi:hypothetical protein